ncbi:hypothetical protein PENTCL1PPCAC_18490, partial [Pristionchus entomophagus]
CFEMFKLRKHEKAITIYSFCHLGNNKWKETTRSNKLSLLLPSDLSSLLLGHSDSASLAAGSLGVLSTDTESPVVTETSVEADLLQTLEILTPLVVDLGGTHLRGLSVLVVSLSVEEPVGDLVLGGVLHDGGDLLDLLLGELSSASGDVNVGLAAADEGVTTADSLDGGEGEGDHLVSIDVGVHHTMNVLELLGHDERRHGCRAFILPP